MKFKIFRFNKVKSTNLTAIRIIKNSNFSFGMVISKKQSNGKGRYGKKWISYNGNLFVSFFYKINYFKNSLEQLTKLNCLLVKDLISKYYKKRIVFKKPNDLLIQKKKISGILQEIVTIFGDKFLIVGIGINIKKSPKIRNYPTTSLDELTSKSISKQHVANKLKLIFERNLLKMYKLNKKINK